MRLLQIYNQYRSLFCGEEKVVMMTAALVEKRGGTTHLLMRSSRSIVNSLPKKVMAFFSGVYSFAAATEVSRLLAKFQPDIVHAHNLYPLLSPSVLVACRRAGIPVVYSLHNFHQTCPNANHLHKGQICEECMTHGEISCVANNCRDNYPESLTYALRSYFSRKTQVFTKNVNTFICLNNFTRQQLVRAGFNREQLRVLPNMVDLHPVVTDPADGQYVGFAGRLDKAKGIQQLLDTARLLPDVPFHLAGDGPRRQEYRATASANVRFLGQLTSEEMKTFYQRARMIVAPSVHYEMCPLVISEAMGHGLPVIASRVGGIPELVDDGITGLLCDRTNTEELAAKILSLWRNTRLCRHYGTEGRQKAEREYGESVYYDRLAVIYDEALGRKLFRA